MVDYQTYLKKSIQRDQTALNEYNFYLNNFGMNIPQEFRTNSRVQEDRNFKPKSKGPSRAQTGNQRYAQSPLKQSAQISLRQRQKSSDSSQQKKFQNNLNKFYGISTERATPAPSIEKAMSERRLRANQDEDQQLQKGTEYFNGAQTERQEENKSIFNQNQRNQINQSYPNLYPRQLIPSGFKPNQLNPAQAQNILQQDLSYQFNPGMFTTSYQEQYDTAKLRILPSSSSNPVLSPLSNSPLGLIRSANRGTGIKELYTSIPKSVDNRWSYQIKDVWSLSRDIRFRQNDGINEFKLVPKEFISKTVSEKPQFSTVKSKFSSVKSHASSQKSKS